MVNIFRVDLDRLNIEIEVKQSRSHLHLYVPSPRYCIMNEDTFEALKSGFEIGTGDVPKTEDGQVGTFVGLDIVICNRLKLGEVDVR